MRRQLMVLIGMLIFSSCSAAELSENILAQLGAQGYFYGPSEPQNALILKRNSEGRYLICLSENKKEFFIYEVTESFFPDGVEKITVLCKNGALVVSSRN